MSLNLLPYPNHLKELGGARKLAEGEPRLLQDGAVAPEGYRLTITADEAVLAFADEAGRFYGEQTLRQLRNADGTVPLVEIDDAPRMGWRGFMIDSSRHIQTVDEIKAMIDAAASYKCNVFHWHLGDDPGWRLESERYPLLNTVGAWRDGWGFGNPNPARYGGLFTKAQIRDIVAYCAARHVTVVPEFDIPGHSSAVLMSYPALSCSGEACKTGTEARVYSNVLCAGKEETFDFCFSVLEEIMELFPGKYIHIGGDEVPKDNWNACPLCQKRMKEEGLKNGEELQGYFTRRIAGFLKAHGRIAMGWNEVLEAGLDPDDIVAVKWDDPHNVCDDYANRGGKILNENRHYFYLDYSYRTTPLRKTFSYDPLPDTLTEAGRKNVLGVEAPIWTEWVEDFRRMGYQCFPRLLALAERGWTAPGMRGYDEFKRVAELQRTALAARGIEMAPYDEWDPVAK